MKNFGIILKTALWAMCVTMFCSCSSNPSSETSEPIEINGHQVLIFPSEDLSSIKLSKKSGGSAFSCTAYNGKKNIRLREQYNINEFDKVSINVGYDKKIEAFDVYEINGLDGELRLAKDVKGIALRKANGAVLTLLIRNNAPFWTMRHETRTAAAKDLTRRISVFRDNAIQPELLGITDHDLGIIRLFLLPVHEPTNNVTPMDVNNFADFAIPAGDGLKPSKDSTVIYPCYGDKPQILIEKEGNGSCITICKAQSDGSDIKFHVDNATYAYDTKPLYDSYNKTTYDPQEIIGAAIGLPNGTFFNIIQCKNYDRYKGRFTTKVMPADRNNGYPEEEIATWIRFRSGKYADFPHYIPDMH